MNRFSALIFAGNCRRVPIWAVTIVIVTPLVVRPAYATDFSWLNGVSGAFSDSTKWTPVGGPPHGGDVAILAVPGTYTVSGGGTVTIFQVSGGDVTLPGTITTDSLSPGNALFFAGGTARVSGSISSPKTMEIGQDKSGAAGNGTLRVFGGGSVLANANIALNDVAVSMAGQLGSSGTLVVENTNSKFTANGGLNIAGDGTASVSVLAGGELITSGDLPSSTPGIKMGVGTNGTGSLLVDGANARVNNTLQMNVGQLGNATFTVGNGGVINTSGTATLPAMVMGFASTATGVGYVENGGTLNTTSQFVIGGGGNAEFYLSAGGTVTSNAIGTFAAVFIANAATSTGTATMNGGTWDVNGDFFLGGAGHGKTTVNTGATLDISAANSLLTLGFQDGGLGELFLNGGQLLRPNTDTVITVGIGGRGRMEIHDGTDVADAKLRIAQLASSSVDPSEVIVEGAGSTLTLKSELAVGIEGAGQLRVQNGGQALVTGVGSTATAGAGVGGLGEIFVTGTGSTLSVAGTMTLGGSGIGNLAVDTDGQVNTGAATIGQLANSEGNANVESGGLWNIGGDLVVGGQGTGFVYLRPDGTIALPSGKRIFLGLNASGTGFLNLYGNGALNIDTEVVVGQNGHGIFTINDGATYDTLGSYLLGNLSTAKGDVQVNTGSTFTVHGDLTVGVAGQGSVTVDDTSTFDASNGNIAIGLIDGSIGEVVVDGGTLLRPVGGLTTVGFAGRGRLVVRNGATVSDGDIRVAQIATTEANPSEVIVDGAGTSLTLSGGVDLGIEDVGNLSVQAGGQMTVGTGLVAGIGPTGQGNIAVNGSGSKLKVNGVLIIAESGTSFSSVGNNGLLESPQSTMARQADSEASMDVANGGTWNALGNLVVADLGRAFLYVRAGGTIAVQPASQLILGNGPGSSGILNLYSNGSLNLASDVVIGNEGAGALNLFDGATYTSFGSIALGVIDGASGNISVNSASSFTVNGSLTMAEALNGTAGLVVDGAGSVLHATNIHVGGSSTDIGGLSVVDATDQGHIYVTSKLNVWGSGAVHITGGAITVGSSVTPATNGTLRVNAGGTLSGSGLITGDVLNAGGTVAPGNSPGMLTVVGGFTQAASGTLQIQLAGTAPGSAFDVLAVEGAATLAGKLDLSLLDGFVPSAGDVFQFVTATGTIAGAFTTATLPVLAGANWLLEYAPHSVLLRVAITGDYNHNGKVDAADYTVWRNTLGQTGIGLAADGNGDHQITRLDFNVWKSHYGQTAGSGAGAAVPEPATSGLILIAAMGLLRRRHRRSANA